MTTTELKDKVRKIIAYLIILEQYETTKYDDKLTIQQMIRHYKKLYEDSKRQQDELAKKLGVSRQTISSLERGRYNPSIFLAHKIAVYFDMTIEDIFIFEEEEI